MSWEDSDTSTAVGAAVGVGTLGVGVATGNPLLILGGISALAGTATSALGTSKATKAAKQTAQFSMENAGFEMQINAQRQIAMRLAARRQQMEIVRTAQRARALGLTTATSQGAQFGSALSGAYGQISGQSGVNSLGISQNLGIGENIFGLDNQISQNKIRMAQSQGALASAQGMQALGGSLVNASGALGRLGGLSQSTSAPSINPGLVGGGYLGTGGAAYSGPGQYS